MTLDLNSRVREQELMDAPDVDVREHRSALRALARVNAMSWTAGRVWRHVAAAARHGPVRLLDVGCGGGDVVVSLLGRAQRAGIDLVAEGCDRSPTALAVAEAAAAAAGVQARFLQLDVLEGTLPHGYDLICCSLFLHHLDDEDAVRLLRSMAAAGRRVVVQDLIRSPLGYAMAWGVLRVVSRSRIARVDGPLSVRAAFTVDEAREIARRAGLEGARVERCWPERFQLVWQGA